MNNILNDTSNKVTLDISIDSKLYDEIKNYYNFNHIDNIKMEIEHLIEIGFNIERFGSKPFSKFKHNQTETQDDKSEAPRQDTTTENAVESEKSVETKTRKRSVRIIKN